VLSKNGACQSAVGVAVAGTLNHKKAGRIYKELRLTLRSMTDLKSRHPLIES
jgi:hypothetical protein